MTNLKSILTQSMPDNNTDYKTQYLTLDTYINENFDALCQDVENDRFTSLTKENKKAALLYALKDQLVKLECQFYHTGNEKEMGKAIKKGFNAQIADSMKYTFSTTEVDYTYFIEYKSFLKQDKTRRAVNFDNKCKWLKSLMEIEQLQASNHQPVITPPEDTQQFSVQKCLEMVGVKLKGHRDLLTLEQFYQHLDTFVDTHFTDLKTMISDERFSKLQDKHQKVIFLKAIEAGLVDYASYMKLENTTQDKNFKDRCHNLTDPKNYPYAQVRADDYKEQSLDGRKLMFFQKIHENREKSFITDSRTSKRGYMGYGSRGLSIRRDER